MEPIRHLEGVWRAKTGTQRVGAAPITTDDLDPGMDAQPGRKCLRFAVRGADRWACGVPDPPDRAEDLATKKRKIVDQEHPRGHEGRERASHESGGARHLRWWSSPTLPTHPLARLSAQGKGQ